MDEDNFEKERFSLDFETMAEPAYERQIYEAKQDQATAPAKRPFYAEPSFTNPLRRGGAGIAWVRASDLLSSGSGRIAGRGLDFETAFSRRIRQAPAVARQAMRERADRLPPLSEFGASSTRPSFTRSGPGLQ